MGTLKSSFSDSQDSALQAICSISGAVSLIAVSYPAYKLCYEKRKEPSLSQKYFAVLMLMNAVTALMYIVGRSGASSYGFCQLQAFTLQAGGLAIQLFESYIALKMYSLIVDGVAPQKLTANLNRHVAIICIISLLYAFLFLGLKAYGPDSAFCWIEGGYDSSLRFFALYISLIISFIICVGSLVYILYSAKGSDDKNLREAEVSIRRKLAAYVWIYIFCWSFGLINRLAEASTGNMHFSTMVLQAFFQPSQGLLNSMVYTNSFTKLHNYFFGAVDGNIDTNAQRLRFQKNAMKIQGTVLQVDRSSLTRASRTSAFVEGEVAAVIAGATARSQLAEWTQAAKLNTALSAWEKYDESADLRRNSVNLRSFGGLTHYKPKFYSVFSTTFNLGEAKYLTLKENMSDWLLPNHDIYCIGVQEALDLANLRDLIHAHLGGPSEYTIFKEEIGSDNTAIGYHGYIALTMFIRKAEVDCGNIREIATGNKTLATGRDLGLAKATNKGAIGIPFQIHDTTICFLTSHLPSDSKGVSKLGKRNSAAKDVLAQLVLGPVDVGFSSYKQCDHFIFTGDLNYRIDDGTQSMAGGGQVCKDVAKAAVAEKTCIKEFYSRQGITSENAEDLSITWRDHRANLLRCITKDPFAPPLDTVNIFLEARLLASVDWDAVLRDDELANTMKSGHAFSGFEEASISFAPSYKRKVGHIPDCAHCGDYTDAAVVFDGFSNTEGMEDEEIPSSATKQQQQQQGVSGKDKNIKPSKMRPPSYTDRILVHSLPDRASRLALQAYDSCEKMIVSDHRPVTMVMTLEVNDAIIYPVNFKDGLDAAAFRAKNSTGEASDRELVGKDKFYLFELIISELTVVLVREYSEDFEDSELPSRPVSVQTSPVPAVQKFLNAVTEASEEEERASTSGRSIHNPMMFGADLTATGSDSGSDSPQKGRSSEPGKMVDIDLSTDSEKASTTAAATAAFAGRKGGDLKQAKTRRPSVLQALFGYSQKDEDNSKQKTDKKKRATMGIGDQIKLTSIKEAVVAFPLPCKDPFVQLRKIADLAKQIEIDDRKTILDTIHGVGMAALAEKYKSVTKLKDVLTNEDCLKTHTSKFPVTVVTTPTKQRGEREMPPGWSGLSASINTDIEMGNPMYMERIEECKSVTVPTFRVLGCVVPELGAHMLVALVDSLGNNNGELCVPISHLIDLKSNGSKRDSFSNLPVTRGGELVGHADCLVALSLLTILSLGDLGELEHMHVGPTAPE